MTTDYNLHITKALNGWIVRLAPTPGLGVGFGESFVVGENENLGEAIAAVLVSGRLDPAAEQMKMLMEQQAAEQMAYVNRNNAMLRNAVQNMPIFKKDTPPWHVTNAVGTASDSGLANAVVKMGSQT